MNYEVRYYSQTGNSKKLALAIAEELGIEAKDVKEPVEFIPLFNIHNIVRQPCGTHIEKTIF